MTRAHRHPRRGISTLWLILTLPIFLTLLVFTVDIANLWLARVELENGLEAAALAAVRQWGEAGGGSTEVPRQVGVAYAQANTIRGLPVTIAPNYNENTPNQNAACCQTPSPNPTGNLVFGAIREINDVLTFNAGEEPACGIGTVLFDVTGNNLDNAEKNAWGVSFYYTDETPANITIASITYDLPDGHFVGTAPGVSDRTVGDTPSPIIPCQSDVLGLTASQIHFAFENPVDDGYRTLQVTFDPGVFQPGERFRFGVATHEVGTGGNATDDGDGVGVAGVRVTVVFAVGGVLQSPVTTSFVDTETKKQDCLIGQCTPAWIKDLPCPPDAAQTNDGQSYVRLNGAGQNDFAVRAQATVPVGSLARKLLGNCIGPYYVTAKTTARYNCSEDRAWLIRVERFICPGPTP